MKSKLFKTKISQALQVVCGLAFTFGVAASAQAQANWPDRPIKLIVGYPPGGPVDTTGRVFARYLSDENRAGASGVIGADVTAKATPDGYTLNFVASPSLTISPIVQRSKLFNPRTDFTLISPVVSYTNVLLIGPQIPAKNVGELVDYARQNPEKVSFGSAGFGGSNHLSAELLKQSTKTEMLHVPYKGNAPAMVDVMGGKVTFMFDITSTGKAFIDSGKARGLAVTSRQRNPSLPNIPTMIEAGIPDFEVVGWFAVIGPKSMPQPIVAKLTAAVEAVKRNPEFIKSIEAGGYLIDQGDAKALSATIDREYKMWEGVITKGNIYPN
jgi:tripartite-type tricarboxylate transporter receptor subunit TctC